MTILIFKTHPERNESRFHVMLNVVIPLKFWWTKGSSMFSSGLYIQMQLTFESLIKRKCNNWNMHKWIVQVKINNMHLQNRFHGNFKNELFII